MKLIAKAALIAAAGVCAGALLATAAPLLLPASGSAGASRAAAIAAALAATAAGSGIFALLAHRALRPLKDLADAAATFSRRSRAGSHGSAADGSDAAALPALEARPDEVGALAGSVREMQQRLEHRNAALTRAYLTVMESEQRLAGIIDHLSEGFLVVEADGTIQRANPAAARLLGYAAGELPGLLITTLGWNVAGLDARAQRIDGDFASGPAGPDEGLGSAERRDGIRVPVELGVTRVEQDGRVLYCVLTRDLTMRMRMEQEVRRSREFLERVVELMPVAVFLKDAADLRFSMANRAMERLTGVPREALIGRCYADFPRLDPALTEAFTRVERQLADGRQAESTMQYVLATDAGPRTVRATTVALTDDTASVTHLLGVIEDLSDQIAVQQELEAEKQRAEAANQAKTEFLANMSHELRTPLNAIIGYGEMLDEIAREEQREQDSADLRRIVSAGRHLLTLINAILDLAKIESGRTQVCYQPLDVDRLITDVRTVVEPLIRDGGNRFDVHGSHSGTCVSDEAMLCAILTNLLGNAAKFTRGGEVSLHYRVGEEGAEFRVRDSGIGIDPDVHGKIFQPFVQADASTSRAFGGTGLGLTLCRRYCDQLEGEIHVDSAPGRGATFTVRVPNARYPAAGDGPLLHATNGG